MLGVVAAVEGVEATVVASASCHHGSGGDSEIRCGSGSGGSSIVMVVVVSVVAELVVVLVMVVAMVELRCW